MGKERGMAPARCRLRPLPACPPASLQAYAMASHMAKAHGTVVPLPPPTAAGEEPAPAPEGIPSVPPLPALLAPGGGAPAPAPLPGVPSVPPLRVEGQDLSAGLAAAFPGYAELRLLAPSAELRLLQAGVSGMVNPHNLRRVVSAIGCAWLCGGGCGQPMSRACVGLLHLLAAPARLLLPHLHAVLVKSQHPLCLNPLPPPCPAGTSERRCARC